MAGDDTTPTERLDTFDTLDSADRTAGPPRRGGAARRALTAAVAAAALLTAGAFGAFLVSGSDSLDGIGPAAASTTSETDPDPAGRDRGVFRHHGYGPMLGHGFGLGGAPLHGELVVPDPDSDGYRTVVVQRGQITSTSGSALTVRSEDGFAETYSLTDETVYLGGVDGSSSLQEGEQVHVTGVREGGTVRAVSVADLSRLRQRFGGMHDWPGDRLRGGAPGRT